MYDDVTLILIQSFTGAHTLILEDLEKRLALIFEVTFC